MIEINYNSNTRSSTQCQQTLWRTPPLRAALATTTQLLMTLLSRTPSGTAAVADTAVSYPGRLTSLHFVHVLHFTRIYDTSAADTLGTYVR